MKKAAFHRSIATLGVLGALMLGFQNCSTLTPSDFHEAQDERSAAYREALNAATSRNETPDEAATAPEAAPTRTTDLKGTWAQACSSAGQISQRTALTFDEDRLHAKISIFPTGNCSGTPGAQIEITGDYAVKGESARVHGASSLIVKAAQNAKVTAMSDMFAYSFNRASYCGVTTWSSSVPQKLPLNSPCLNLPSGSLLAGSKQVVEVQDKHLYFGNSDNSKLDLSQGFERLD